jgi:membrane-associated HD superfamily phosphohydrolase
MSKRLQDLATPLSKIRRGARGFFAHPFENLSEERKFWLGFAFLCTLTTFLINNPFWRAAAEPYKEGDIARESVISPADISVNDAEETERIRESARGSVQPIFVYESKRSEEAVQSFRSAWENLARKSENGDANTRTNANANSKANGGEKSEAQIAWTGAGGAEVGKIFAARRFSTNELEAVTRVLRENADGSIYGDQDRQYFQEEITLNDRQKPNQQSIVKMPESNMTALSEARNNLKDGLRRIRSLSEAEVEAFNAALAPLIQPSVVFDSAATENARQAIEKTVMPVTISLKRGQTIVREGDTITPAALAQIAAIRSYSDSTRRLNRFFGLLALVSALFWVAWKFIEHRGVVARLVLSERKTFALFGFIVLAQTALMAVFFRLAEFTAAQNVKAPLNDPTLWALAIPFAFGSLLMTLLADRRTALFTGTFFIARRRNARAEKFGIRSLHGDHFGGRGLRHRALPLASIGNDGGRAGRFGKRGGGSRATRLHAAAVYSEHGRASNRLRFGERFDYGGGDGGFSAALRKFVRHFNRCQIVGIIER